MNPLSVEEVREIDQDAKRDRDKEYHDGLVEMQEFNGWLETISMNEIFDLVKWNYDKAEIVDMFREDLVEEFRRRDD
jgi:hypothetical protein